MSGYYTGLLITLLIASCSGSRSEKVEAKTKNTIAVTPTENLITPGIPAKVDSFEIVYYKKPYEDSTRYARFFRVAQTNDSALVSEMERIFMGPYVKLEKVKKCLSEGKVIFHISGDAYRTIYFSRLETNCPYLYYIKDGWFYYYEITPELNERLKVLEIKAVEPGR